MDKWQSGFQAKRYVTEPQELFCYGEPDGILDQLCLTLEGGTSMQILGERSAGKTSVLHCIETRFIETRRRHLPVYLEFQGTGVCDPINAYRHIVAGIHAMFLARSSRPEDLAFGHLRLSTQPNSEVHFRALQAMDEYQMLNAIEDYFRQLNARGFGVLLLFDEYEYLMREVLQGQADKFWQMRRVAQIPSQQGSPCPLTIVLAGALEWSDFCGRYGSPPLNIVSALRILPPLPREAFGKMWLHCQTQCGSEARRRLDASGVSIDRVYDLTGGWAYAGKMIGQHAIACNRIDEGQLATDFRPHFEVLWRQRTDVEREHLLAMARGDAVPVDAVVGLRQRGLVADHGRGGARLRGELWRRYVETQLATAPLPLTVTTPPPNSFRRGDGCFLVRYGGGEQRTFPDTDGFYYLAELLRQQNPATALKPWDLLRLTREYGPSSASPTDDGAPMEDEEALTEDGGMSEDDEASGADDEAPSRDAETMDEPFDRTALQAYCKRLHEIKACVTMGAAAGKKSSDRNLVLEQEFREICETVAQGTGHKLEYVLRRIKAGENIALRTRKGRKLGSNDTKKAWDRVRKALDNAVTILEKKLPDLAEHLRDTVKKNESGCFAYRCHPPIEWDC